MGGLPSGTVAWYNRIPVPPLKITRQTHQNHWAVEPGWHPTGSVCSGPASWSHSRLPSKNSCPIVVTLVAVWGCSWRECLILCHCDNKAVVSQVNTLHARDPPAGHLLRYLAYLQGFYDCRLQAIPLPAPTNTRADHLCCNRISSFNRLLPPCNGSQCN